MAQNPDPAVELPSYTGAVRTLDDWATVFNLAIVMLPARPEASAWVPVIDRIYATLGDSDVRACVWVPGPPSIARRILGDATDRWLTFCDEDAKLAKSLGLEMLPAFVHLRQDTSLVTAAQGWSASGWQEVADGIARALHWTSPRVQHRSNPAPTPGWAV